METQRASEAFPERASVTLDQLDLDPYPVFQKLRQFEPVCWMPDPGLWLVTRREDVLRILADSSTFSTDSPDSLIQETFGSQMLSAEGKLHSRYKSKCFPSFRPDILEARVRGQIQKICDGLIDSFAAAGRVELRRAFANPLAINTVSAVLDLPDEAIDRLPAWYECFAAALANFSRSAGIRSRGLLAADQFRCYLRHELRRPGPRPSDSLLDALMRPAEDRLSEEEILSNSLVILFGGIETTESALLNLIWALLTHPDQLQRLVSDPDLAGGAIEESLRWDAAVQSCTRYTTTRAVIRDVEIEAGQTVQCMLGAANRDPEYFNDPDVFDICRADSGQHLTFGFGRHLCLGAALARMELQIGLRALLDALPNLRLNRELSQPPRGHEFRKPPALYVEWG